MLLFHCPVRPRAGRHNTKHGSCRSAAAAGRAAQSQPWADMSCTATPPVAAAAVRRRGSLLIGALPVDNVMAFHASVRYPE